MMSLIHKAFIWIRRNNYGIHDVVSEKKQVNLEFMPNGNLGDELAPIIYKWMLNRNGIDPSMKIKKTRHLMSIGSLLGMTARSDATIWGTGTLNYIAIYAIFRRSFYRKFDIRCVRGPITRNILLSCKYECPEKFGDPGVLMPLIYKKEKPSPKKYEVSMILHMGQTNTYKSYDIHQISIMTKDYQYFIDEVCASQKVISSSLHGIIIAEAYGIPAVFLCEGMDQQLIKFYDWYFSTGRMNVKMAKTLDEALTMEPMELPNLDGMRQLLIDTFPYDLWDE